MTDDMRDVPVDNLEVSVRTAGFLSGLGVETLGQLLDLEAIELPEDWSPRVAALVAAELRELFDELGVTYAGTIFGPEPAAAELEATGTVAERWETIRAWLAEHHPGALEGFNPPAPAAAVAAAEEALGHTLPDDYKRFLEIANGQDEFAPFVGLGALLPIEKVAGVRIFGEPIPIDHEDAGPGVRAVDYSPGWVPISRSARGRDYLCIDLDPAPGGASGQIIEYVVDGSGRPLVAASFADLLSLYFAQIQSGEIDLDDL